MKKLPPMDTGSRNSNGKSIRAIRAIDPNLLSAFAELRKRLIDQTPQFQESLTKLAAVINNSFKTIQFAIPAISEVFSKIAEQEKYSKLLADTGWLPHAVIPFEKVEFELKAGRDVSVFMSDLMADDWPRISREFETRVSAYNIDPDAKAAFSESLIVHGIGGFRSVPRLLFPEFERLGADEFHNGQHQKIASLRELRKAFRCLPAGAIFQFENGYSIWRKIEQHVYERCESAEQIKAAKSDPVPNRHACLHGIVTYDSMKSSYNSIVLADLFFHLIDRLKFYSTEVGDEDSQVAS